MTDDDTESRLICQWVNQERTVLARQYDDGTVEVALRDDAGDIWGIPVLLELEL